MRTQFAVAIGAALIGALAWSAPALAQQKTVKACQAEWQANKADNQAKGITEKAYVAQCRAGGAPVQPAATPAETTPTPAAVTTPGQKTAKACQAEWRANKDANQKAGITEKAYVAQCRAGTVVTPPATPAAAPVETTPTPTPTPVTAPAPKTKRTPKTPPAATTTPTGADQFTTEADAKGHCPADLVVWVNLSSKVYHFSGARSYGKTKQGAYICEKDALTQGFRASKREKRPSA